MPACCFATFWALVTLVFVLIPQELRHPRHAPHDVLAWTLQDVKFDLQLPPKCKLIAQPPADLAEGDAAMLHYTWGSIWKDDGGKEIWSFDKRFYTDAKLELEVNP